MREALLVDKPDVCRHGSARAGLAHVLQERLLVDVEIDVDGVVGNERREQLELSTRLPAVTIARDTRPAIGR